MMNTVSFESPVTTYLPVSRTSCVPTTSRIFLRSLDRDQSSHRYRCYLHYRHAIRSCSKVSREPLQCFTSSIIFYTSSEIFAGSRLNEHDFGSFCAPIISRFERRFRTLTLKKKWEWWDLIGVEKGFVISSNFTPFCCNLHTKVKLSKGRENWLKVNEEWETLEILYQISFRG